MDAVAELNAALSDRYHVEREIGRGGMATVYLARDIRHDRRVALKVLNAELGAVLGVERFLAEIKVTANLQHPNLLPLFDSGQAAPANGQPGPGLLFYVMPFVEGESLRARLNREKQLPVDEALRIATAIASALGYAHRHGVIHRDLKPENILLSEGQPLIADFGIALAVSNAGGSRITQTGLSLGTPQYMSPEQATGDRAIDGRSDIYSLAALTYEMLTGEPPHTGSTSQAIVARLLTEQPRSVRAQRPTVSEHVDEALARALEKLPADRFPTAEQFAEALHGHSTFASSVRVAQTRGPRTWRARLLDPVVLTLAAVAIAASLFAVRGGLSPQSIPERVVRYPLNLPPGIRIDDYGLAGTTIAVSPDGAMIVFIGSEGGNRRLFMRALDDITARALPGTDGAMHPFFSPDGKWVGFWADDKLKKVPMIGGAAVLIADCPTIIGATWSPSGEIVASVSNALFAVRDGGGLLRRVTKADSSPQLLPMALPDGDHVLFSHWAGGGASSAKIAVASLSSGAITDFELPGTNPMRMVGDLLIYSSLGAGLLAVPFDAKRLRVGGTPTVVVPDVVLGSNGGAKAGISATGTLVYKSGSTLSQVVAVGADGKMRVLYNKEGSFGFPRLSPDGTQLALTVAGGGRSDIWVVDIASGAEIRLTSEGKINDRPEWTPDGTRVLYRSDRAARSALWWRPVDQSERASPLLVSDKANYYEGVLTPDGKTVVFQVDSGVSQIGFRAVAGDTTIHLLTAPSFAEDRARVSPDGRWIVFQSLEAGSDQVVARPFPGPGRRVRISIGGGMEPLWSPDGKRIFYRQGASVIAAAVSTTPTLLVTSRTKVLEGEFVAGISPHANYDVTPNGKELVMLKSIGEPYVIVVHNWGKELRERISGSTMSSPPK